MEKSGDGNIGLSSLTSQAHRINLGCCSQLALKLLVKSAGETRAENSIMTPRETRDMRLRMSV